MALIVCTVYGLKSTGASFRNHLADCMQHSGWSSCIADADVLMKLEILGEDGYMFSAYCVLYVDDILMVHHNSIGASNEIVHFNNFFLVQCAPDIARFLPF